MTSTDLTLSSSISWSAIVFTDSALGDSLRFLQTELLPLAADLLDAPQELVETALDLVSRCRNS